MFAYFKIENPYEEPAAKMVAGKQRKGGYIFSSCVLNSPHLLTLLLEFHHFIILSPCPSPQRPRQGLKQEGLRPHHRPRDGRGHDRAARLTGE